MKLSVVNAIIATILAGLLAWWLWTMGEEDLQKWLLAAMGGAVIWLGLLGGMGVRFENERSGVQAKIVMFALATITFGACCIYSFFQFSPVGFCVPVGIFSLLCVSTAYKIYETKE